MPRKGEPEQVLGADGQSVDNLEQGIGMRKANIDNVFTNENINFNHKNILFYDALQCYLGDGSLDPNYEISDIAEDRERIFAEIDQLIIDREQHLISEIDILSEQFQQIQSGNNLTQIEDALVIDAAKKISRLRDIDLINRSFSIEYINMLPEHHSTLRATNNRYGQYELRGIDIYFNGRYLAESLIRQSTKIAKVEISRVISFVQGEISQDSTLHPLMQRLCSQIDINYESISIDLSHEIEAILTDKIFAPQDYADCIFWQNVIDRWGQGSGYKNDVLLSYQEQLGSIDHIFNQLVQTAWRDRVIQNALTFLGETKSMVI